MILLFVFTLFLVKLCIIKKLAPNKKRQLEDLKLLKIVQLKLLFLLRNVESCSDICPCKGFQVFNHYTHLKFQKSFLPMRIGQQ